MVALLYLLVLLAIAWGGGLYFGTSQRDARIERWYRPYTWLVMVMFVGVPAVGGDWRWYVAVLVPAVVVAQIMISQREGR